MKHFFKSTISNDILIKKYIIKNNSIIIFYSNNTKSKIQYSIKNEKYVLQLMEKQIIIMYKKILKLNIQKNKALFLTLINLIYILFNITQLYINNNKIYYIFINIHLALTIIFIIKYIKNKILINNYYKKILYVKSKEKINKLFNNKITINNINKIKLNELTKINDEIILKKTIY